MVPAFGFSTSDLIGAICLINDFCKALKDSGGSNDNFALLSQDLEQLKDGVWGEGGNIRHVNAVRAMALTVQTPLKDFLAKMEKNHCMMSDDRGVKMQLVGSARKMQWDLAMREDVSRLIATKLLNLSLLLALPTTLPRLESRTIALQSPTTETRTDLSTQFGGCQNASTQAMREM